MGQEVDQALNQLAATRAGLERDIDELFSRLPEPSVMAAKAKTYGVAAGGAAATVGLLAVRQKRRSELHARRMEARINAEELARAFSPHPPAEPSGGSRTGVLAVVAAVVVVALVVLRLRGQDGDRAD